MGEETPQANQLNQLTQRNQANSLVHYGRADASAKINIKGEGGGAVTASRNLIDYSAVVPVTRADTHEEASIQIVSAILSVKITG